MAENLEVIKLLPIFAAEIIKRICQQYSLCSDIGSGFMEMTIRPFTFM